MVGSEELLGFGSSVIIRLLRAFGTEIYEWNGASKREPAHKAITSVFEGEYLDYSWEKNDTSRKSDLTLEKRPFFN